LLSKGAFAFALKTAIVGTSIGMGAVALQQSVETHQVRAVVVPQRDVTMNSKRGVPEAALGAKPSPAPEGSVAPAASATRGLTSSDLSPDGVQDKSRAMSAASASRKPDHGESAQQEAQRVAEARRLLRTGDAQRALAVLASLDRQPATRLLEQERAALRVDALLQLGRRAEAIQSIQRFRARYPHSPLAERWSAVTGTTNDSATTK
jgi:hypothetical protein